MKLSDLFTEAAGVGQIVKGVNTTPDVGPDEISKQAAKFGMKVDKNGQPPIARTDGKLNEKRKPQPVDKKLWRHFRYLARKKFQSYIDVYSWAAKQYKKHGGKWTL
jgi:hypothetical protein